MLRPSVVRPLAACVLFVFFTLPTAFASVVGVVSDDLPARLRASAKSGKPVVMKGVSLGRPSLDSLELQPMEVWAKDATIAVYAADGTFTNVPPPDLKAFQGKVKGIEDSIVFLTLDANDKIEGMIMAGEDRFRIRTAVPLLKGPRQRTEESLPLAIQHFDEIDELTALEQPWACGVEGTQLLPKLRESAESAGKMKTRSDAGAVAGATYQLRLAMDTDDELYAAFGSTGGVTTYLTNLVGAASTIYQRDLGTTLTIGHSNVYSGGPGSDPWIVAANAGTAKLLGELGTYWHNTNTANYAQVQRSAVAMISGKLTNGGIAWIDVMCGNDFFCGADGLDCGSADYANSYGGAYVWNGSLGSGVTTTVPDASLTVNGVQYGMPANNNFWMLAQFAHELGHAAASQHSHCVPLTPGEKATYGVTRDFVDNCASGESFANSPCYSGSTSAPTELGGIMSYCHNIFGAGGFRQSRYLFGKTGEASEKMISILKFGDPVVGTTGIDGSTPNGVMTTQVAPIACSAGRTASVVACAGCTYAWQITGGTINTAANIASITYTPSGPSVTLTATITAQKGCGITVSKTLATSCGAVNPPTNVLATATSGTTVNVAWTNAAGATSYNVYRSTNNSTFTKISTDGAVTSTPFVDGTAVANTAYAYRVRSVQSAVESTDSNKDFTVTVVYTDPNITAQSTSIKAAHITQLRDAVNALRTLNAGQGAFSFTDAALNSTIAAKVVHITQLRTELSTVRVALGFPAFTPTTDPTVNTSTLIKKAHIDELRAGAL